jgi:hypothetical protein
MVSGVLVSPDVGVSCSSPMRSVSSRLRARRSVMRSSIFLRAPAFFLPLPSLRFFFVSSSIVARLAEI